MNGAKEINNIINDVPTEYVNPLREALIKETPIYNTGKTITISLDTLLTQTYMVHAALLAVKLLALSPLTALTWVNKGLFTNTDIVRRAYLSELKNLAPFWIVGVLYITTDPPVGLGTTLFRVYTVARMCVVLGYATRPLPALISDMALITSYFINFYMSISVIYHYRYAL
ncbi:microsomal glutathione S-transferase 1-like [Colias croceus]|uniref:microsomal glutathione S-transferase 1-like n=1 Tax=Colias crocea TaxID=72248 RepID=UPI001E27C6E4|nr:microsomal glutathione S-transferase 1-like [Colias croceus]